MRVGVGAELLVGVVQQVDHVGVEGVEGFWPVERRNAQALVGGEDDLLLLHIVVWMIR